MNYTITSNQKRVMDLIENVSSVDLYYITIQQDSSERNLTLRELKKLIIKGIRIYYSRILKNFKKGEEDMYIKYLSIFETTKDFNRSQHNNNNLMYPSDNMGIHFHLFISTKINLNSFNYDSLSKCIKQSLQSLKHKKKSIKEYGSKPIVNFEYDFKLYHTKQFYYQFSSEMILKNF